MTSFSKLEGRGEWGEWPSTGPCLPPRPSASVPCLELGILVGIAMCLLKYSPPPGPNLRGHSPWCPGPLPHPHPRAQPSPESMLPLLSLLGLQTSSATQSHFALALCIIPSINWHLPKQKPGRENYLHALATKELRCLKGGRVKTGEKEHKERVLSYSSQRQK